MFILISAIFRAAILNRFLGDKKMKSWSELPKGPELSEAELEALKAHILAGDKINLEFMPDILRRLVQTLERFKYQTPNGFTEELPAIGQNIYLNIGFGDYYPFKVVGHVHPGKLVVFDYATKETIEISGWATAEELAKSH